MSTWAQLRDEGVLIEDSAMLVLNKPAGWSVMGERHETDLVRTAEDAGEKLYPAHRIDKVTSGAVLFAKELRFHGDLTRQFNKRSVDKAYLALTRSSGIPERGTITLPLSTGRKGKIRVAARREHIMFDGSASRWYVAPSEVFTQVATYPSVTAFVRVWQNERHSLLVVLPLTGRRHQIRVHLAWIGHPIEGDPLFEKASADRGGRACLHSWRLAFDAAWRDGERIDVEAPPGDDFWRPVCARVPGSQVVTFLSQARRAYDGIDDLVHSADGSRGA